MCVCVCVCERVREREKDREREKVFKRERNMRKDMTTHCRREWVSRSEPEKAKERKWERGKERERERVNVFFMKFQSWFLGRLSMRNLTTCGKWESEWESVYARVWEREDGACHLKVLHSLDFLQIKSEWLPISPTNLSYLLNGLNYFEGWTLK